eukprot:CAMPEP_0206263716 /NCGR_PEP_ID=MMETSP0047_2-20121206/28987_1 /ASSEMBLY_ACC=CAM_ASM_000192 /TAXON_ID=195065 /ORGANISM="Chroomonas mesostigmatica_cf, Strain CCMP1168" /LENGTH=77 /DNA_ID=CAMNT_0053691317 /DNA_START=212 /DNA_END=445 /DNA_ORIENTATION=-
MTVSRTPIAFLRAASFSFQLLSLFSQILCGDLCATVGSTMTLHELCTMEVLKVVKASILLCARGLGHSTLCASVRSL